MNLAGAQEASAGHGQEGDPGVRMSTVATGQPGESSPGTEGAQALWPFVLLSCHFQNDDEG